MKSKTKEKAMSLDAPYPDLDELIVSVGDAGARLSEIGASEGAAGNISICIGWQIDPRRKFPLSEKLELPILIPGLAGYSMLISGSGRRLREIKQDPIANLGFLVVDPDGSSATLYTSPRKLFARLTSELNSHLAIHEDHIVRSGSNFHACVHAQPLHLTYLSHIEKYQDEHYLNRHLLRWQPEAIVNLPDGIGVVPFFVPGSEELMSHTKAKLREHRLVIWSKHGVISRSDISVKRALDRIEYGETAAHYEYVDLVNHASATGLTDEEIKKIADTLGIEQTIF
jgi:rhamnulose-1-phosphate aldolase